MGGFLFVIINQISGCRQDTLHALDRPDQ